VNSLAVHLLDRVRSFRRLRMRPHDRNGSSVDGFRVPGLMTTRMRFVGHGKAVPAVLMSRQLSFFCPPVVPGQLRHSPDQVPGRGLEQHQSRTVVRQRVLTLNERPREREPKG
jgi:hypothetical protein